MEHSPSSHVRNTAAMLRSMPGAVTERLPGASAAIPIERMEVALMSEYGSRTASPDRGMALAPWFQLAFVRGLDAAAKNVGLIAGSR